MENGSILLISPTVADEDRQGQAETNWGSLAEAMMGVAALDQLHIGRVREHEELSRAEKLENELVKQIKTLEQVRQNGARKKCICKIKLEM